MGNFKKKKWGGGGSYNKIILVVRVLQMDFFHIEVLTIIMIPKDPRVQNLEDD